MNLNHTLRCLVLSAALGSAISAEAGIVFYTNRVAWQNAAGPSSFTENFSGFTTYTPFKIAPLALNGMTIQQEGNERFDWNEVDVPPFQFFPNSGSNAALMLTNFPEGVSSGVQVRISFTVPNKAFGFESWGIDDEGAVLEAFNGATLVGAQSVPGGDGSFFGYVLTGQDKVTSVRFRSENLNPGMFGERFYIDNLAGVAAGNAPVFTSEPRSQAVSAGSTVVFNALATNAESYRWERNGVALSGATSGTLMINSVSVLNAGIYVALATNSSGATSSAPATLTVIELAPPVFAAQPVSQVVAAGSTVVFNAPATGAESYRWEQNGVAIAGATSATLVIKNVSALNAGTIVSLATNSSGTTMSATALLTILDLAPPYIGRLVNLSILTLAGSGARVLTLGAIVGGGDSTGALPLVIRAVGPTLAQPPFNVLGVLPDPVMTFHAAGNPTPIDSNDNWSGSAALSTAFRSVGAFELPAASLDSAIVRTSPGAAVGGYTVQVTGKGDASGSVIAEIYDAAAAARTAATPRLTNLSTRTQIDAGAILTVGFVLGGQSARTMLIRGVGPSLAAFGIGGFMTDPRLELFDNGTGQRVASNDDWAGSVEISMTAASVGAFPLAGATSKDAVLLVTLPPGPYSVRISGVAGTGGTALVEVYEVP